MIDRRDACPTGIAGSMNPTPTVEIAAPPAVSRNDIIGWLTIIITT
ncbi:hypothetical protein KJ987_03480 [bacterium]|nr:hypothetical protein [bacterium]